MLDIGPLARRVAMVAAALALVASGATPAHASDGSVFTGNRSGGAWFDDGLATETIYIHDYEPDGYGVRVKVWQYGSYYGTYDYTGGAGTGDDYYASFYEGEQVELQACSRDSVSGGVRVFNCGSKGVFYA
ncbi:hypothetical protein [Nonomuraea sp. NPDC050310]|uniref:hypothetical protein n=1 Tax=Nonomuraea sp. NPDC050310 TaxID=3154935 RepID=UPI0033FF750D